MVRMRFLRLFISLASAILAAGCSRSDSKPSLNGGPASPAASADYFATPFQEESQFIVESVVSDVAEEIFYARNHRLPDAGKFSVHATEKPDSPLDAPVFQLQVAWLPNQPPLQFDVNVQHTIWSAETYEPAAIALARQAGLNAIDTNAAADASVLMTLTDSKAETIEKENQKISWALETDFTNPALHEQAALVIAAFALRDHSGNFLELRSPLCRLATHLTMARYLRGSAAPGVNGQIAEAASLALMNAETAALKQLDQSSTTDPGAAKWVRALRARVTGDFRPLADSSGLSPLERVAWFRAFATSVDVDLAWTKLTDPEKLLPDFMRIAAEESYSVGTGHELLQNALSAELKEIGTVHGLSLGKRLTEPELASALNRMPEYCFGQDGKVRVIGWGQWAAFLQRQLCHTAQHNFDFLHNRWGVPDEAKDFRTKCDGFLGGLRLYPFVRRFNATDVAGYHSAVDDAFRVTVASPHLVPAECWNYLCFRPGFAPVYTPNPNPHINEWHSHNPLPGTVYDISARVDHRSLVERPDVLEKFAKLHELAPYDIQVVYYLLQHKYHGQPTYEQAEALFRPALAYNTYCMRKLADTVRAEPDRYEKLMVAAAALDPYRYFNLGEYFRDRGQDDKAAEYLERGCTTAPEPVSATSYADWRIKYYLKKGQTSKAQQIADDAGEVYSAAGLEAKAAFLEATGKYAEAFDWYAKEEERYNSPGALLDFCARYKARTGDARFDNEVKKRLGSVFPAGIEKAALQDFKGQPRDGVSIRDSNEILAQAGMARGNVIVAVNGIRTHTFRQYEYARDTSAAPEMVLVVWQNDQYREVRANPPNHRFGVPMGDYPEQ